MVPNVKSAQFAAIRYSGKHRGRRVQIMRGKHKGLICEIEDVNSPKLFLETAGWVPYVNCEFVNSLDQVVIEPVLDQTGRPIDIGSWIVYSAGGGKQAHRLEIGRVESVGLAGGLTVSRNLTNGQALTRSSTKVVNDPDRALLLPVSEGEMIEWVMRGFTDLGDRM